jgi:hypothetical protein
LVQTLGLGVPLNGWSLDIWSDIPPNGGPDGRIRWYPITVLAAPHLFIRPRAD